MIQYDFFCIIIIILILSLYLFSYSLEGCNWVEIQGPPDISDAYLTLEMAVLRNARRVLISSLIVKPYKS